MGSMRHRITAGRHLSAGQLVRLTQDFYVAPNPCDNGQCDPPVCEDPDPDCCELPLPFGSDGNNAGTDAQQRRFYRPSEIFAQTNGGASMSGHFALGGINLFVPSHSQIFSENRDNLNDAASDTHSATYNIMNNLGHARYRKGAKVHDPMPSLSYGTLKKINPLTPAMSIGESSGRINSLTTKQNSGGIDFAADNQIIPAKKKSTLVGDLDPRNVAARQLNSAGALDDENANPVGRSSGVVKPFDDIDPERGTPVIDGEATIPDGGTQYRSQSEEVDCRSLCGDFDDGGTPGKGGGIDNNTCCGGFCCGKDLSACSLCGPGGTPCAPACTCCGTKGGCKGNECDDDPGPISCDDCEKRCCFEAGECFDPPVCQNLCKADCDGNCPERGCNDKCGGPREQPCGAPCYGTYCIDPSTCQKQDVCGVCGGDGTPPECPECPGRCICINGGPDCSNCDTNPGCGCGSGRGPCEGENECCEPGDPGSDPIGNNGCFECDDCPDIVVGKVNGSVPTELRGNFASRDLVPFVYMKHDLNLGKGTGTVVGRNDTILSSHVVLTVADVFGRVPFVGASPHAKTLKLDLYELLVDVDPPNANCSQYAAGSNWTSTHGRNTTDRSAAPISSVTIDTSVTKSDKIHFDITEIARRAVNGDGVVKFMIEAGEYFNANTGDTPAAAAKTKVAMMLEFFKDGENRPKIVSSVLRGQSSRNLAPGVARRRAIVGA